MLKRTIVMSMCISMTASTAAAAAGSGDALRLIPRPRSVEMRTGMFYLQDPVRITVESGTDEDLFAAGRLIIELRDALGGSPGTQQAGRTGSIRLRRGGPDSLGAQGYILSITADGVDITAAAGAGLFYGVQTLRQLIRANLGPGGSLPCLEIVDRPALQYRGWQDDISRGPIPTLDYLKRQVRQLSEYKLNCMTLYTEHVFKLKKHPRIAPRDGITAAEIQELVRYAADYHVEVIGNFQSFGHFEHILNIPEYAHLAETRSLLSPAFDESYEFLADAFAEIAPAYTSRLFTINCDETFGLGTGPARSMVRSMGKEGVYAFHINRVHDLLAPYGKRLLMWGDIARDYPDIIPRLPRDLIVLPWGYHAAESFERDILPFTEMGFEFIVCPGVSCWRNIWPDFETAVVNISNFVRDGVRHGALGMLNTSWDDDGENLFNGNWYPLIWGAGAAWNPLMSVDRAAMKRTRARRLALFDRAFSPLFFRVDSELPAALMKQLSQLRRFAAAGGLANAGFWQKMTDLPLQKTRDTDLLAAEAARIEAALSALSGLAVQNRDVLQAAAFAASRVMLSAERQQLRAAMKNPVPPKEQPEIRKRLAEIAERLTLLKAEYRRLWNLENRQWWLDRNLKKYDELIGTHRAVTEHVFISPAR